MRICVLFSSTIALLMLKKERQAFIIHQVQLHNKVLCTDLCARMQVSDDTIRRDLQELSDKGQIIKVHGGALSRSFFSGQTTEELTYSFQQKQSIAQKAVSLIHNGMYVMTGGGTTIVEMAHALPGDLQATFISGSLPALMAYAQHPLCNVIVLGDKLSKTSKITVGPGAIAQIGNLHVDLCFLGINALDPVLGVTDNDWEVVQLKKAMIGAARKTVCLTISEKLHTAQPLKVCTANAIHTLITELDPDDEQLKPFRDAGIQVL
jgi:DeoR/GlpR family transcriptional regulator of sugar metabolism